MRLDEDGRWVISESELERIEAPDQHDGQRYNADDALVVLLAAGVVVALWAGSPTGDRTNWV